MNDPQLEPTRRVVCGVELSLVATEGGGRQTPLLGGSGPGFEFQYRPNWCLPGMTPPEQSGAMVYGFSRQEIQPAPCVTPSSCSSYRPPFSGSRSTRAWCCPATKETEWAHGRVLWREDAEDITDDDKARWLAWLADTPEAGGHN